MQSTQYTCDRCGYRSEYGNPGWIAAKTNTFLTTDLCPACVNQVLGIGLKAEKEAKGEVKPLAPLAVDFA